MTITRSLTLLSAGLLLPALVLAEDLPSPDAMALGAQVVPRALVEGLRRGLEDEALSRIPGGAPRDGRDARARLAPILDEVFPPELLAGIGATFLARHYTGEELRALRAFDESPLGAKLHAFRPGAAEATEGSTPAERDEASDARFLRTFSGAERTQLDAFAASPLGKKSGALAPDLAAFFMEQLERRWASARAEFEPRLRAAAAATP